ncbi:MAG: hypothetical protein WA324_26145 [Bryobacteraceae bacterium]|jgi:hypothetical protein
MTQNFEAGDFMIPEPGVSRQQLILNELLKLTDQGRKNTEELSMIRVELGLHNGALHGRLPSLEGDIARQDLRLDKLDIRVGMIEKSESEDAGKQKLKSAVFSLLGGSASGAMITMAYHLMHGGAGR